ncbi:GAF domain-containing protein [Nocardioides sp. 31GB23]|uniref:helix-turn-helix domain-containing protein n=1 Tax=Nocardioides sp. 31GB23 TaxID=3156065 RepID=UPI0032AF5BD6
MAVDSPRDPGGSARQRELTSLYATARSLTALGDLDDVLRSIVRHAHDLIGTDFTYLSLVGANGGLAIRASEGTISAAFRAARIPPGTGLGGRVLQTRAAHHVSRYAHASDLEHDPGFDDLVGQEGLIALLGVPLLVRGEAIGVLFAADRSEREFRTDEIALLSAFADHAAVALDNARLYDESRTSLERLRSAYRTIEDQVAEMERAQSAHEALTGVVVTGGGPEDVARRLVTQLGGAVTVLDRDGVEVARADDGSVEPDAGAAAPALALLRREATSTGRCASGSQAGGGSHSVAPIRAGERLLGTVAWTRAEPPGPVDDRTLELAAHVLALLILNEDAVADAEERLSGELLTELMTSGPTPSTTHRARARSRGVDLDALDVLVIAEAADLRRSDVARRLHTIARDQSGLAGEHAGHPTLLLPSDGSDDVPSMLHQRLRRDLGQPVTVVAESVGPGGWTRAFTRASRSLVVAAALGRSDTALRVADLALYGILVDPDRSAELDEFVTAAIGPLVTYDARRSTELVRTLAAYFEHGENLSRTARALHVHPNTLVKRLDRAAAVLDEDWRSGDDLQLRMAVRLHLLRQSLGRSAPAGDDRPS